MVTTGQKILASDYNGFRSSVSTILSTSYGQTLISNAVTNSNKITAVQLNNLFLDIQRTFVHQTGNVSATIAVPLTGNTIGADTSQAYNQSTGAKTAVIDGDKMSINDYNSVIITISSFDGSISGWPVGNFTLGTALTSIRSTSWGGSTDPVQNIYHVLTVTFVDANQMNYYFNAGGEIRFAASLSSPSTSKDIDWQGLLSVMGTVIFNKYRITASSGIPTPAGSGGSGYDSLTGSYRQLYIKSGSGVYANNEYTIEGRISAVNQIRFRISMNDDYIGAFIDQSVTGTITSTVNTNRPDSSFIYNAVSYNAVNISAPTLATAVALSTNNVSIPS